MRIDLLPILSCRRVGECEDLARPLSILSLDQHSGSQTSQHQRTLRSGTGKISEASGQMSGTATNQPSGFVNASVSGRIYAIQSRCSSRKREHVWRLGVVNTANETHQDYPDRRGRKTIGHAEVAARKNGCRPVRVGDSVL